MIFFRRKNISLTLLLSHVSLFHFVKIFYETPREASECFPKRKWLKISLFRKSGLFRDVVNTTQKPQMDIQFKSIRNILKVFPRCMKVSISVLWRRREYVLVLLQMYQYHYLRIRTYGCKIQTYWLCVWEKGAIKVCAYIQYFFRLLLYSNCMDDNNNKYRKKSVQGIISFHEYIIIMNIGQSILITERVSLFF